MSDDFTRPTPVDLDGIGRRLHHVRNSIAFGPSSRRLAHTDIPAMMAEIAWSRAEIERLKANQLPDGGEWDVEYEAPDGSDGPYWSDVHWFDSTRQRNVWTGPAEPIPPADPTQPATR